MTDYTTLANVKAQLGATETADDALLTQLITDASRMIDRYCAGAFDSDNYFALETVTDKVLRGVVGYDRYFRVWPLKPVVSSVTAIAYRYDPADAWTNLTAAYVMIDGYQVSIGGAPSNAAGKPQFKITYTGGYATIPADVQNVATLLTIRFYREIKSGLTDAIGVAELGTLQYTRAIPVRVQAMLAPYRRVVP